MNDENGEPLWTFVRDSSGGSYDAADIAFSSAATGSLPGDNITALALVLVSHGPNGYGALLPSGARLLPEGAPIGGNEDENRDGDNTFVSGGRTSLFDDVLMWRTQDQILAETGAGSCAFP